MIGGFVKTVAVDFLKTAAEMSPFLLLGFLVAGLLSVFVSQRIIERHLGGRGIWPLLKASFLGIPLPLCSCGVIPVSVSLHKHGAGKGSTISFLLSTPQTGVDSILVTFSLLGPVFGVFRPVAALVTGIVGGVFVDLFAQPSGNGRHVSEKCTDECCAGVERSRLAKGLKYGFATLPRDIGASMLIGLIVAALISATIPQGFFAEKLGTGILAMLVMMLLGVPIYVCATASVPVAAALLLKGVTPGAVLVFLMTGPATNARRLSCHLESSRTQDGNRVSCHCGRVCDAERNLTGPCGARRPCRHCHETALDASANCAISLRSRSVRRPGICCFQQETAQ